MADKQKTRLQAVRDRARAVTKDVRTKVRTPFGPQTAPSRPPPVRVPPASVVATQPPGTSLVPAQSRALTTPGRALVPSGGGAPPGLRVPPLRSIGDRAAAVGSRAARFLGRVTGIGSAAIPTDVGNAENTPEAADLQQRFADFTRLEAQGGFARNPDGTPQTFAQSEELFAQKQELDRQRAVQQGLRGRQNLPARGQGFIQNQNTGQAVDFGQNDPQGQRLDRAVSTTPSSSPGLRQRSLASRQTGNAFADVALGFGDAARAAIAEGRGQADRARSQRLRETAISNLPAAQKEARLAEEGRAKRLEADAEAADKFRTSFDTAPTPESKRAVQREAQADLAANGPDSPGGRFAIGQALDELGKTQGGIGNAIFGERGVFDFVNSIFEGFPNAEFSTAAGLFLSKDGDIMQDVGGGEFTVVAGLDDLPDFARETLSQVLTQSPEEVRQ